MAASVTTAAAVSKEYLIKTPDDSPPERIAVGNNPMHRLVPTIKTIDYQ
jgi:hypothetical protein